MPTRVKYLIDIDFHDPDIISVEINSDDKVILKICSYYAPIPENITITFHDVRYINYFDNIEGKAIYIEEHGFWYEKRQFYSNKFAFKLIFLLTYPDLKGYPVKEFKIYAEDVNIEYN